MPRAARSKERVTQSQLAQRHISEMEHGKRPDNEPCPRRMIVPLPSDD